MGNCVQSSFSKQLNHDQIGHLQRYFDKKQNRWYFKSQNKFSSIQKYHQWSSQTKKLKYNIQTKDFLYLPLKTTLQNDQLSKKQKTSASYYEPYIETMQDLLKRYKQRNSYPSEQLLWYLIYSLTKTGKYFEKLNKKIGNLKLANILISENQQIKIICEKTTIIFISGQQELEMSLNNKTLFAPQQLIHFNEIFQKKKSKYTTTKSTINSEKTISQRSTCKIQTVLHQDLNPQISEVYTTGLIVLGIANLIQPHTFYKSDLEITQNVSIDFQKIQTFFQNLKTKRKYSDLLLQTIKQMIEKDPLQRKKASELFKKLSNYEKQILSKKGINYTIEQIQKIKNCEEFVSQNKDRNNVSISIYNSEFTAGQRSMNNRNDEISFRVSEISERDKNRTFQSKKSVQNSHIGFINIL